MFMESLDQTGDPMSTRSASRFTDKQGPVPGVHRHLHATEPTAPAEADFQRFFRVTAPAVHQMIVMARLVGSLPADQRCPEGNNARVRAISQRAHGYRNPNN